MKYIALGLSLMAFASPSFADTFRSFTGLKVTATGTNRYVVSGVPNYGPADYWCTIGDYAQRILRVDPDSRIYVVGDYKRGQRTYTFSTSPEGTAAASGPVASSSTRVDGASRRANAAKAECYSRRAISNR
jgi:hypothetical protein